MRLWRSRSSVSSLSRSSGGSGCRSGCSSSSSWSSDNSLLELGLVLGEGRGMGHGNETDDLPGARDGGRFSAKVLRRQLVDWLPEAETGNGFWKFKRYVQFTLVGHFY
jgi:hypothetical protein